MGYILRQQFPSLTTHSTAIWQCVFIQCLSGSLTHSVRFALCAACGVQVPPNPPVGIILMIFGGICAPSVVISAILQHFNGVVMAARTFIHGDTNHNNSFDASPQSPSSPLHHHGSSASAQSCVSLAVQALERGGMGPVVGRSLENLAKELEQIKLEEGPQLQLQLAMLCELIAAFAASDGATDLCRTARALVKVSASSKLFAKHLLGPGKTVLQAISRRVAHPEVFHHASSLSATQRCICKGPVQSVEWGEEGR